MCKIKNLVKRFLLDVAQLEYKPFLTDDMCQLLQLVRNTGDTQFYSKLYQLLHSNALDDKYKREHTIHVSLSDYLYNINELTKELIEEIELDLFSFASLEAIKDVEELTTSEVESIVNICKDKIGEILNDDVHEYITTQSLTYTYESTMLIANVGACYPNEHINNLVEYGTPVTIEGIAYDFLREEYAQTIIDSFYYGIQEASDYLQEELNKLYVNEYEEQ